MPIRRLVGLVAALVAPPPPIELPPPAPEGRRVLVHGGADSWWIDGLPPRTVAQPPGVTLLLEFDEVETREAFARWTGRTLHRSGPWLVVVFEAHGMRGDPSCDGCGGCGCTAECGPAGLCGNWLPGDGWYYPASAAEVLVDRKPPNLEPFPPACWGERLMESYCVACHSMDDVQEPAPSLGASFHLGAERELSDGRRVTIDGEYIRRSIVQPQADRLRGHDDIDMPPFRFSDAQLEALTAYLVETPKERELRDCASGCPSF